MREGLTDFIVDILPFFINSNQLIIPPVSILHHIHIIVFYLLVQSFLPLFLYLKIKELLLKKCFHNLLSYKAFFQLKLHFFHILIESFED